MLCSYGLLQSRDLLSLISVLIMNYLVDFHRLTIYARPFRKTSDVAHNLENITKYLFLDNYRFRV